MEVEAYLPLVPPLPTVNINAELEDKILAYSEKKSNERTSKERFELFIHQIGL